MQPEHLLDAILLAALHHQHHIEVDEVEHPHQQQEHGHARQQAEVAKVALAAHQAAVVQRRGVVEVELLQGEELVAYVLILFIHPALHGSLYAVDAGAAVDGGQVHGGQHVYQFAGQAAPSPVAAHEVVGHHHVEVEGGLARGLADDTPHGHGLALVVHRPAHGILAAEKTAGAVLGQHGIRRSVQGRFAHPHGVAEEVKEGRVGHQHVGLAVAFALRHVAILHQDEATPLQHLAVGYVDGVRVDPVAFHVRDEHIAVRVLQGHDDAPAVHTVRVHRVLAVEVAGQQDKAAQAQGQADDINQGVSFGTCQVACRVLQGFHNGVNNLSVMAHR